MGRGGAGNWYQPKELSNEGTFTQTSDSTALPTTSTPNISTPWHPENQQMPIARVGRGGAGNFVWQDEDKELERRGNEERVKKGLEEKVERDVEAGLAKPRAAVLGGEKAGKGW
ncbi:hypothetical protein CC78DRAFT_532751 [Lojkania enalia]|uniref:Uncharacterized protein n=1 Tax=Lojkania enalia TaxID=147567 RepID=A0A9P4N4K6_9PLEO|nr:hypothetical protein CC78DRAFT_532751 [Didymosphaeria enalia]